MADKQIIPYGADLNKKPDTLALTIVPPEDTPIHSRQYYFTQVHQLVLTLPQERLFLKDKLH